MVDLLFPGLIVRLQSNLKVNLEETKNQLLSLIMRLREDVDYSTSYEISFFICAWVPYFPGQSKLKSKSKSCFHWLEIQSKSQSKRAQSSKKPVNSQWNMTKLDSWFLNIWLKIRSRIKKAYFQFEKLLFQDKKTCFWTPRDEPWFWILQ